MTINSDFVLGAEFGNEGTANDVDNVEGGDDDTDNDDGPMGEPPKKYGVIEAKDWVMHAEGGGRPIKPVPYTGNSELFKIKLADGDLDKIREWLLPKFGESGFYKFIATRMWNHMIFIIIDGTFKPSHCDPFDEIIISVDHVARFFGCQLVRAIKGLLSVDSCWSTRKALDAVETAKESMPCGAFSDSGACTLLTIGRRKREMCGTTPTLMRRLICRHKWCIVITNL